MTFAGIGLYCSTKYAVEAITESLRFEVRPFNIQVAVGGTRAPSETRFKDQPPQGQSLSRKRNPLTRPFWRRILYFA